MYSGVLIDFFKHTAAPALQRAAARRHGATTRCQAVAEVEAPPKLNIAKDVSELIGARLLLWSAARLINTPLWNLEPHVCTRLPAPGVGRSLPLEALALRRRLC